MTTLTRATIAELVELHDLLNGISTTVDEWMQAFDNNEKILRRTLIAEIQYHNKKQNNYDLLYWNAKKITTKQLVELDNLLNGENNTLAEWIDAIDNEDELRETLIDQIQGEAKAQGYDGNRNNYDTIYWFAKGRNLPPPQPLPRYDESKEYKDNQLKLKHKRRLENLRLKLKRSPSADDLREHQNKPATKFAKDTQHVKYHFDFLNPNREAIQYVNRHQSSELEVVEGVIIVNYPQDYDAFTELLTTVQNKYNEQETDASPSEPFIKYYLNRINSVDDVFKYVDKLYDKEMKPFKINFGYGGIYEEEREENRFVYTNIPALQFETGRFAPVVIRNEETKQLFKDYFITALSEMINNYTLISTRHKLVCIHSLLFKVFRLNKIGAKIPGLDEFLKSKMIKCPTEDDNFCFDYVATMFKHPQMKPKDIYRKGRVYAYKRVFNEEPNVNSSQYRLWCKEYKGFDFTNDIKRYCDFYHVNVDFYEKKCNETKTIKGSYALTHQHIENDDYEKMSILLVSLKHRTHAMLILPHQVDKLTGFVFCSKCQQVIARTDKNRNEDRALRRHLRHCTGKPTIKKTCQLDEVAQPYIPHIMKNRTYAYCLAHNIKYEPIRYYITFDFETMEHKVEQSISEKTVINSYLKPLMYFMKHAR